MFIVQQQQLCCSLHVNDSLRSSELETCLAFTMSPVGNHFVFALVKETVLLQLVLFFVNSFIFVPNYLTERQICFYARNFVIYNKRFKMHVGSLSGQFICIWLDG